MAKHCFQNGGSSVWKKITIIPRKLDRTLLLTALILLCSNYCVLLVFGKVSQINYGKHPFELRSAFPSSPRPPIIFYSGNSTLEFSASHINPKGFDFSKIHSPRSQQPSRNQNVAQDEKIITVIRPLAWVNLPFFDTPSFINTNNQRDSTHFQHSSSSSFDDGESRQVQRNDSLSSPHLMNNRNPKFFDTTSPPIINATSTPTTNNRDDIDDGAVSESSRSRSGRPQVVKSDWDGRTKNEIAFAENGKITDFSSFPSTTSTSTINPLSSLPLPSTQQPQFPLERRIPLSNRGRESNQGESGHRIIPAQDSDAQPQDFGGRDSTARGLQDGGGEDPFVSESRMRQETDSTSFLVENSYQVESPITLGSTRLDGIISEKKEEEQEQLSHQQQPVGQATFLAKTVLSPSPVVPNHHSRNSNMQPNQNYHQQNSGSDYRYQYAVSNKETMDVHSHSESRTGATVEGQYSVLENDGWTRIVSYIADSNGFRATVKRVKV